VKKKSHKKSDFQIKRDDKLERKIKLQKVYDPRFAMHLDRQVLLVKLKDEFYKWINSLSEDTGLYFEKAQTQNECPIYLVPIFSSDKEMQHWIDDHADFIFQDTLESFVSNSALWPRGLPERVYKNYIEFHIRPLIKNLVHDSPLEV